VLSLYNIQADTGGEGSRLRQHEGLVYRVLDGQGNKVGTPIKASLFYSKPTLKTLKSKFAEKAAAKNEKQKVHLKNAVDLALLHGKMDLVGLSKELKKLAIDVVIRQNREGVIFGLTYVDHRERVVFNGSDLGKNYSAKAMLGRCTNGGEVEEKKHITESQKAARAMVPEKSGASVNIHKNFAGEARNSAGAGLVETLLENGSQREEMDWQLKRKKKKKKRQRVILS